MAPPSALERSWRLVRELARQHPEGWDGEDLDGSDPLVVYTGPRPPRRLLVISKHAPLLRWPLERRPPDLAVVIASGRLGREHLPILNSCSSSARPIPYVGDADPLGLHTFASLRSLLGARRTVFAGVSDRLLAHLDLEGVHDDRRLWIRLSAFERAHLHVVDTLLDPSRVLGSRTAAALAQGAKLEIEALSFRAQNMPAIFEAALALE